MTLPVSDEVKLGVTHLLVNGQPVRLLNCPFCNFRNIDEDTITHHIKYNQDARHNVEVDKLDKTLYIVSKTQITKGSRCSYTRKEDLPDSLWPWINCPWCNYRDNLPRDLEWHFLEKHKNNLYREIAQSEYDCNFTELLLSLALELARERTAMKQ